MKVNSCFPPVARSSVISRRLPACSASDATVSARPRGRISPPSMRLVEAAQEPGGVPGRCPSPLALIEQRVRHRRRVLQRREQGWCQLALLDPDAGAETGVDDQRRCWPGPGRDWRADPVDLRPDRDPSRLVRCSGHFPGTHPSQRWTGRPTGPRAVRAWPDPGRRSPRPGGTGHAAARRSGFPLRRQAAHPGTGTAGRSWPGPSARAAPSPRAAGRCPGGALPLPGLGR